MKRPNRTATTLLWAVFCSGLGATNGAELRSSQLALTLRDGVVVELRNQLTQEAFVVSPKSMALPAGLHRLNEPLLPVTNSREVVSSLVATQTGVWPGLGDFELRAEIEPDTGDVLLTQTGTSPQKKLAGISWAIADIPDQFEVLVPGCSGQRFSASAPAGRREFDYPMMWEAGFVLLQGRAGGFLIRADDDAPRYKNLTVEHSNRSFRLRFESRNLAPFTDKERITSCRWRLTAYQGDWLAGAALYRQWAAQRYPTPGSQERPDWVRNTQFVVTLSVQSAALLPELARHCDPAQTLLYVTDWRAASYDRDYPDYTAVPEFDDFIAVAHRLGFRVMPHVNYFGCQTDHPFYEQVKHAHYRNSFTGELLGWEWPAHPPIKFAYINPASRVWRAMFIARMTELVRTHHVDALHLDQTLCIYNDANGLVDGLTGIEGSQALHRELRAALPDVALSGEGLNEITSPYEAFAQRHIWSMDHMHFTWNDRLVAMSHPVSSAVLATDTKIYGYIGMANPGQGDLFTVWQRAYEAFGALPTYNQPDATQLTHLPPHAAEAFQLAQFFQRHQPRPDFDSVWQPNDVFRYRLADGGTAFYRQDHGVVFGWQPATTNATELILSRRIEGVNEVTLAGSIPGWPAYDGKRLLGLDPKRAYAWSATPRDLNVPHLTALPEGMALEQAGVHENFARFQFQNLKAPNEIQLWDFEGPVKTGVRFADGTTRVGDTLHFEDSDSGGLLQTDQDGLFIHPPWRGEAAAHGRPITFAEFTVRLPQGERVRFTGAARLRDAAVGQSDGATHRVSVRHGPQEYAAEIHQDSAQPQPLELDLTPLAGQLVQLRLTVDAGPKNDPSFDWALLNQPRVVVQSSAPPVAQTIHLAALKEVRAAWSGPNQLALNASPAGTAVVSLPLPGPLILMFAEPTPVTATTDLLATRFTQQITFETGIEIPDAPPYLNGVTRATSGGVQKHALSLQPPIRGRALVDWLVRLPDAPVRLLAAVGFRDGPPAQRTRCEVLVNGASQFERVMESHDGWLPVEIDLTPWRGQPILLTCLTRSESYAYSSEVLWSEPRLASTAK